MLLSIKNGLGLPSYPLSIRPRYDAVIDAGASHARFDEFNLSELNWTRSRYSSSSEKLVIFEDDPFSIHWRIAWTDSSKTVTLFNKLV